MKYILPALSRLLLAALLILTLGACQKEYFSLQYTVTMPATPAPNNTSLSNVQVQWAKLDGGISGSNLRDAGWTLAPDNRTYQINLRVEKGFEAYLFLQNNSSSTVRAALVVGKETVQTAGSSNGVPGVLEYKF